MSLLASLHLPYIYSRPLPGFQNGDDLKFPDTLVAALLKRFTQPGDKVLDPFCGLGTTFFVCEDMSRMPYGIEADPRRFQWTQDRIQSKENLIQGDSANILSFDFPLMDFSITSPPYMPRHHTLNPLYNGDPAYDGYDCYLARLQEIYKNICKIMKPDTYLVVQADNLTAERYSPLVSDLQDALSDVMAFEGEIPVIWTENKENNSASTQCLVFRNPANSTP